MLRVPVNIHLDLYHYWDARRGGRVMPARADIEPADIRHLLPHLTIVEALGAGEFRYRLVGTRVVADLGRDVTGTLVGARVTPASYAVSLREVYARVCRERRPLFVTSSYRGPAGMTHAISRLLLPLGVTEVAANMVLLSRVTRHSSPMQVPPDWLGKGVGSPERSEEITSAAALDRMVAEWERRWAA
jgi:hypothetical protein